MTAIQKKPLKLFPLFIGCCQEEMNSVFERFANIRHKWGSSVWEPEFILFSLFKPFSTKAVPNSVCYTVFLLHQMLEYFSAPSSFKHSFSLSSSCLFPILRLGDTEVCNMSWTPSLSSCISTGRSSGTYDQVRNWASVWNVLLRKALFSARHATSPGETPLGETKCEP